MLQSGQIISFFMAGSLALAGFQQGAGLQQDAGFQQDVEIAAEELILVNLIGSITIEDAGGAEFRVAISVQGRDATRQSVSIEVTEGRQAVVAIRLPQDKKRIHIYPEMGTDAAVTLKPVDLDGAREGLVSGPFGKQAKKKLHIAGGGDGTEAWADVVIGVPGGRVLEVIQGVGRIDAASVRGGLRLHLHHGDLGIEAHSADLRIRSRSGKVRVDRLVGNLDIETGKGGVDLDGLEGFSLQARTGDAYLKVRNLVATSLVLRSGRGTIGAIGIKTETALVESDSGTVNLAFAHMGPGPFVIKSSGGPVRMGLPADASALIEARNSIGDIFVEWDDIQTIQQGRHGGFFRVGSGASAVEVTSGGNQIILGRAAAGGE